MLFVLITQDQDHTTSVSFLFIILINGKTQLVVHFLQRFLQHLFAREYPTPDARKGHVLPLHLVSYEVGIHLHCAPLKLLGIVSNMCINSLMLTSGLICFWRCGHTPAKFPITLMWYVQMFC